jgi:type IV pilus biogenesis protein PilP
MSSIDKRLCFGLIFCAVLQSTLAIAQTDRVTLGDYIATQRAVLEAEVLKVQQTANQSRNATGSVSPVDAKAANVPPAFVPPPPPPEAKPVLIGVMTIGGQPVVELGFQGRANILRFGQQLPGTAWRVVALTASSVTLQRPSAVSASKGAVAKGKADKKRTEIQPAEQSSVETLNLSLISSSRH